MIYALDGTGSRMFNNEDDNNSLISYFTEQYSSENNEVEINSDTIMTEIDEERVNSDTIMTGIDEELGLCSECDEPIESSRRGNLVYYFCNCPWILGAFDSSNSDDTDISN